QRVSGGSPLVRPHPDRSRRQRPAAPELILVRSAQVIRRCASLYVCNWSLNDPLCQSQTLPYLRALAADGYPSCLLTCERPPHASTVADAVAAERELAAEGVHRISVRYHDRASAARAASDFVRLFTAAAAAAARHRPRIVHTRTSVPAAVGLVLASAPG